MLALDGVDRVMGRVRAAAPGPTLICVGGLHGNEPAGVLALRRILASLEEVGGLESGELVAFAGNLEALRQGRRFVETDLNRSWSRDRLAQLLNGGAPDARYEAREQVELLEAFEAVVAEARGTAYLVDLHTTSGRGGPFSTVADTLDNRDFASSIPTPMILGLEELVEGTLLDYGAERGLVTVGFESGQHQEPEAVDRAEAAVLLLMAKVGILPAALRDRARAATAYLEKDTAALPRVLEMRYRHDVRQSDGFQMKPGYRNFQIIHEGEVLGRDLKGEIRSPESARILMPLYQEQGEDGFFVVREFSRFWLTVSRPLRRLHLDRFIHLLPGIRRDPEDRRILVVNLRIARLFALQLFHLLGFRRMRYDGNRLRVMARRPGDRE
jgi:succinylglutamate desuccinylase